MGKLRAVPEDGASQAAAEIVLKGLIAMTDPDYWWWLCLQQTPIGPVSEPEFECICAQLLPR